MRKTLYTLDVGGYAPRLTRLTMPLLRHHAAKMGADLVDISDRLYPDWPVGVEKLQVYYLSRLREDDWSVYLDADALVHPDCPDWTNHVAPDTVANNSFDFAAARFRYDSYFMRDGRNVGCGSWCVVASSWCRVLWRPPDDLSPKDWQTACGAGAGDDPSPLSRPQLQSRDLLLLLRCRGKPSRDHRGGSAQYPVGRGPLLRRGRA